MKDIKNGVEKFNHIRTKKQCYWEVNSNFYYSENGNCYFWTGTYQNNSKFNKELYQDLKARYERD